MLHLIRQITVTVSELFRAISFEFLRAGRYLKNKKCGEGGSPQKYVGGGVFQMWGGWAKISPLPPSGFQIE